MKHIVITGGAGFIGSHLCDHFLCQNYAVTAIDNLITGRIENLESARKEDKRFQFLNWDVSTPIPLEKLSLAKMFGIHGVLHFACPASPVDFDRIPFQILKVDSLGTMNTVELALKYSARYIVASTSEIYGDPLVHPQDEEYFGNVNTLGPRACYDEAKRFSEAYVSTAIRKQNLNAAIVRIFNTYGPRMRLDDGRVIPEFCLRALKGEPLPICGDGEQTRSLCFVSDLVEGISRLFESDVRTAVNLGNPDERSILELAQMISKMAKRMTNHTVTLRHVPARPDDPRKRQPNISRAKKLLLWSPKISLHDGLAMTLLYFQEIFDRLEEPQRKVV